MWTLVKALAAAGALLVPGALSAQDYPGSQPVRIIVPTGPGASNDTYARYLADKLGKAWDASVIVENIPGAGGAIGFAALAQAAPDGHTLVLFSSSFATTAAAASNLPFSPENDILPVAKFADGQLVLLASRRHKIENVEDLVREGKAQKLFLAGTGPASTGAFVGRQLADVLGINIEVVNFKSGSEAMLDIAGNRADFYIGDGSSVLPIIEAGDAVPLAILAPTRSVQLPDVPTIAEAGYPEGAAGFWAGVHAPAGTPDAVVEKINADINAVLALDETRELLAKGGATPAPMSAPEFQAFVRSELAKWKAVAEKFDIRS